MQRHGSRLPLASEQIYSQNVSDLFKNNTALLVNLSGKYEFLKSEPRTYLAFIVFLLTFPSILLFRKAWTTKQGHDDLTPAGRKQLFDHGVDFNLSYPHLTTDVLLAGYQDRV